MGPDDCGVLDLLGEVYRVCIGFGVLFHRENIFAFFVVDPVTPLTSYLHIVQEHH